MSRIRDMCGCWLQQADQKIAMLGSLTLKKRNVGPSRNINCKAGPAVSSRIVRHNRPSRLRHRSRRFGRYFGNKYGRFSFNRFLQTIGGHCALIGSRWFVRHNPVAYAVLGSRKIAAATSAMLLGAGALVVAQADESLSEFTRRAYIGIGAGGSFVEPRTPNSSLTVGSNTDTGYHIVGGYDFTSRLSAELYYADLGAADIEFIGTDIGDINYQVYGLSAIGYLYNSRSGFQANSRGSGMGTREGLSLFGRAGIGGINADSELDHKVNHSTHLALGLGAEYGFRNGFAVRGEYRALDTDQQYGSLSLVKRFGDLRYAAPVAAATLPAVVTPEVSAVTPEVDAVTPEVGAVLPEADVDTAPSTASFAGVETVNFDFDESDITPTASGILDQVAAVLGSDDTNIMLEGHTDWIASERYNYQLSLRRAESVRRYLEGRGIDRARMSVRGYGETRPVALNDTAEGRASNRRVDIRIN